MKQWFTRTLPVLALGIAVGVVLTLGQGAFAEKSDKEALPLKELRTFTEVFAKIKNDYVEPVSDKTLLNNAIKGMLAGLDPHSAYLDPDQYKDLQAGTTGEFGGLGIEVGMEDGFVKVISPIDDTPAQAAGVKAGDLIVRLNDTPVKGMSLTDAVKLMRGKPGTSITLTIVREGQQKPLTIKITRAVIKVASVKSRMLEPGYGYVRITQFQSHTGEDMDKAIDKLESESHGKLKGLVLDLRNNPGGVLSAAVAVADAFLTHGTIVYTEGRLDDAQLKFTAKPPDILKGAPLVVLVNGGSASASEIVAGALKDHKRAILMGSRTFGKGSVQTILPMENGAALKLTTARYYTPSGTSIQATGIEPDIPLGNVKLAQIEAPPADEVKEVDLARHLTNGDAEKKEHSVEEKAAAQEKARAKLAHQDFELYEALNLLKGISIMEASSR